jgi:hypothetical protein
MSLFVRLCPRSDGFAASTIALPRLPGLSVPARSFGTVLLYALRCPYITLEKPFYEVNL